MGKIPEIGPVLRSTPQTRRIVCRSMSAEPAGMLATWLFSLSSLYCLPWFAMMLLVPRWRGLQRVIEPYWMFLPLCITYSILLARSWTPDTLSLMMPGNLQEGFTGFKPQYFPQLDGIMRLFARVPTAASLWVHLISINLFAARVACLEGLKNGAPAFHSILLCALFGPLGLLSHFLTTAIVIKLRSQQLLLENA